MTSNDSIEKRAAWHAALADTTRLRITDQLARSDRSFSELAGSLELSTSLVAHHLDVLESVGLIERTDSTADRRRRYVRLRADAFGRLSTPLISPPTRVVFVCTHNSARSQLAAALWRERIGTEASSAGTEPAARVHPGAVRAAARSAVRIGGSVTSRHGR